MGIVDMKKAMDLLDKKIVSRLTADGQLSAGRLAETLDVTPPTVRSRMKNLIRAGVLKVAGLIDPMRTKGVTVALVGISLHNHMQLDATLEKVAEMPRVNWCAVVTGRYDILVEIIYSDDISDLYNFLDKDLSRIEGISSSESFVVMKSKRKWVYLPEAITRDFDG